MCTVLFIPEGNAVFFASVRDENTLRPKAVAPQISICGHINVLSPADALAGGTWAGTNDLGHTIILLNGGFENHLRQNDYRKSRGLIVQQMLSSTNIMSEWLSINLNNIEPFTLIAWCQSNLFQLTWDGTLKHQLPLNADKCHIWSSSTLYDAQAKEHRSHLFKEWIRQRRPVSPSSVFDFFKTHKDSSNGFIMNRGDSMRSVSLTFIEVRKEDQMIMHYYDLLSSESATEKLALKNKNYFKKEFKNYEPEAK